MNAAEKIIVRRFKTKYGKAENAVIENFKNFSVTYKPDSIIVKDKATDKLWSIDLDGNLKAIS